MTRFLSAIVLTLAVIGTGVAFLTTAPTPAQAECSACG